MIELLAAFAVLSAPSPELCREFGVDVQDGAEATGEIVEYHIVHRSEIHGKCMGHRSCAIPVMPDQYIIYVIDDTGARVHEECHALYQTRDHTPAE